MLPRFYSLKGIPGIILFILGVMVAPGLAQEGSPSPTMQSETSSQKAEQPAPLEGSQGEDQIQSRGGPEVFGCPLSLDVGAMTRCFQGVLNREGQKIRNQMQQEFNRNPYLAKLEHERKILQAAIQLPLQPLMTCLKNSTTQAQADLGVQVQRWLANPGEYSKDLIQLFLASTRNDLATVFREEVQHPHIPRSPSETWDRSIEKLDQLSRRIPAARCLMQAMSPHLSKLKQAMLQNHSALESEVRKIFDPSVVATVNNVQAQSTSRVLLSVAGVPPRPTSPAGTSGTPKPSPFPTSPSMVPLKPGLIQPRGLSEGSEPEAPGQTEEVTTRGTIPLPGGYKLVTPKPPPPPPLVEVVPDKVTLAKMAKGLLAERLLDAGFLQDLSVKVNRVAVAGTDPQTAQTALDDLRQFISTAQVVPPDIRFDFGWEVLRFAGHRYLDQMNVLGEMAAYDFMKDLFSTGVMAQCGLFPFVGGMTCAPTVVFTEMIATATIADMIRSWLEDQHKDLDRVMTEAKGPIKSGTKPQNLQVGPGPMRGLVGGLPTKEEVIAFADTLLGNLAGPLFGYHQQVLILAERAARR